jgi:Flp pilus assembly protein TadD/glutathione synthase/RimK-type ligase-like ATP-grasp enzyme
MPANSFAIADGEIVGPPAAHYLRVGLKHYGEGRTEEAIEAFGCGLAASKNATDDQESVETTATLHAKLGDAVMRRGDFELAGTNYQTALRLAPQLPDCWCSFGNLHVRIGKFQEAIAIYLQALKCNPRHWAARVNLVQVLIATRQFIIARGVLQELVGERPEDGKLRHQLGKTHFELNEMELALECFQKAVALNPRDAESINWIGALKQAMGDDEGARAAYAEAASVEPLIRRPAAKGPAEFRVLALYAPFGGNTPTEYLFQDTFYDTDTLSLFASRQYDGELSAESFQLVINLISDADQTEALLPVAAGLVDRLGKPTINDPRKIQRTTRDAVAAQLQGIPHCRVPRSLRLKAGSDCSVATLQAMLPWSSSVLARPVGTHGGDDFEKIEDHAALAAFLSQRPNEDHYLIEYIDYRSEDGNFRKYRFIFVDEEVLPYHLCIGDNWKLHHISTDMANQPWMQKEEEAFLNDPAAVFSPANRRALEIIRQRIGLEYFGIDCALDSDGNLVVFEVNASMLVHARNEGFLYKTPAVCRIKLAFDAMLRKFVSSGANSSRPGSLRYSSS